MDLGLVWFYFYDACSMSTLFTFSICFSDYAAAAMLSSVYFLEIYIFHDYTCGVMMKSYVCEWLLILLDVDNLYYVSNFPLISSIT